MASEPIHLSFVAVSEVLGSYRDWLKEQKKVLDWIGATEELNRALITPGEARGLGASQWGVLPDVHKAMRQVAQTYWEIDQHLAKIDPNYSHETNLELLGDPLRILSGAPQCEHIIAAWSTFRNILVAFHEKILSCYRVAVQRLQEQVNLFLAHEPTEEEVDCPDDHLVPRSMTSEVSKIRLPLVQEKSSSGGISEEIGVGKGTEVVKAHLESGRCSMPSPLSLSIRTPTTSKSSQLHPPPWTLVSCLSSTKGSVCQVNTFETYSRTPYSYPNFNQSDGTILTMVCVQEKLCLGGRNRRMWIPKANKALRISIGLQNPFKPLSGSPSLGTCIAMGSSSARNSMAWAELIPLRAKRDLISPGTLKPGHYWIKSLVRGLPYPTLRIPLDSERLCLNSNNMQVKSQLDMISTIKLRTPSSIVLSTLGGSFTAFVPIIHNASEVDSTPGPNGEGSDLHSNGSVVERLTTVISSANPSLVPSSRASGPSSPSAPSVTTRSRNSRMDGTSPSQWHTPLKLLYSRVTDLSEVRTHACLTLISVAITLLVVDSPLPPQVAKAQGARAILKDPNKQGLGYLHSRPYKAEISHRAGTGLSNTTSDCIRAPILGAMATIALRDMLCMMVPHFSGAIAQVVSGCSSNTEYPRTQSPNNPPPPSQNSSLYNLSLMVPTSSSQLKSLSGGTSVGSESDGKWSTCMPPEVKIPIGAVPSPHTSDRLSIAVTPSDLSSTADNPCSSRVMITTLSNCGVDTIDGSVLSVAFNARSPRQASAMQDLPPVDHIPAFLPRSNCGQSCWCPGPHPSIRKSLQQMSFNGFLILFNLNLGQRNFQ
ncbi:hypothetical protein JAAARDRAFT_45210 [Jaapia argillacea MUCL 33604]|uniref:Uncharacterized protein n=1 Tax=Jaapia argillacea MUCL 33604 TaxID=933084 RepID=A0A067Q3T1_9AGAM|nr:hypothetical protein JAAARDRAFT_45210 [Jaapia argillacea MUCL 33604]